MRYEFSNVIESGIYIVACGLVMGPIVLQVDSSPVVGGTLMIVGLLAVIVLCNQFPWSKAILRVSGFEALYRGWAKRRLELARSGAAAHEEALRYFDAKRDGIGPDRSGLKRFYETLLGKLPAGNGMPAFEETRVAGLREVPDRRTWHSMLVADGFDYNSFDEGQSSVGDPPFERFWLLVVRRELEGAISRARARVSRLEALFGAD